jgi:hypothetical protein
MRDDMREKLLALRGEIIAESATLAASLPAARQAIANAEETLKAAQSAQRELREVVVAGVLNEPIANRLAGFLRGAEIDSSIAGAPGKARRELGQIEFEIADCRDALRQLDRVLNPTRATSFLGDHRPEIRARAKPAPVEVDLITMPAGAAA